MKVIKNIVLLLLVLVLSYLTANFFGTIYGHFSPPYDDSMIGLSKNSLTVIDGLPFAYIFFTTFIFKLFAIGNKKKWIIWLLVPPGLFFAAGDLKHIYLPIILGLIAFYLAKGTLMIYQKTKQT